MTSRGPQIRASASSMLVEAVLRVRTRMNRNSWQMIVALALRSERCEGAERQAEPLQEGAALARRVLDEAGNPHHVRPGLPQDRGQIGRRPAGGHLIVG